jgi:GntR family transcriptional regulator, phosphonate transport system regulatory protein
LLKAGADPGQDRTANGNAGIALWRRLADDLEQSIVAGAYAAGDRLPGELEIAERFGLNRHTVRRALAELAERGLVRAERGSGTYVESGRLAYPINARTRFSEILGAAGLSASGRLVAGYDDTADADIARRLKIKPGEAVLRLEIVRAANRVPVCVATSWMSAKAFPDAARIYRSTHSMTRTLAHFGITDYRRRSTRVSAAVADATDAARLRLPPGRLVLLVDSEDVTGVGRPVVATRARFAADRVELLVES